MLHVLVHKTKCRKSDMSPAHVLTTYPENPESEARSTSSTADKIPRARECHC